jgi:tetratricopeptide (TPR) repeat protein
MWIRPASVCGLVLLISPLACWSPLFAQGSTAAQNATSREIPLQVIVVRSAEEAQQVAERLKKGEGFAQLAREKSIDPTADAGGFMGVLDPATLRAELRDALMGLRPGQISGVLRLPSGFAILKMLEGSASNSSKDADPGRNQALAATGAVKLSPDVAGLSEAESALLQFPKPGNWNQSPRSICDVRNQSLADATEQLQKYVGPENQAFLKLRPPLDLMQAHYAMGQLYAYQGKMDLAIAQYEEAYRVTISDIPAAVPLMEEALGVLHLHKSEMENGAFRAPGKKCIFPMSPADAYHKPYDSQEAGN